MIPSFLLQKEPNLAESKPVKNNLSFLDNTAKNASSFVLSSIYQQYTSQSKGLLQYIDSRVKVVFLILYILVINISHIYINQLIISIFVLFMYILSKINILKSYKKILFLGFFFGFLIFVPASLNIFTKGETLISLIQFSGKSGWWIYSLPNEISITREGIYLVLGLTFKVINSVSLVLLIVSTTSFERIIKSLSFFKVPDIFLLTLTLSYKFIFILSQTYEDTYLALKMRWWNRGKINDAENRIAGRIGFLFRKSWEKYEQTYQAMIARGFTGSANFNYFTPLKKTDFFFILIIILFPILLFLSNTLYA